MRLRMPSALADRSDPPRPSGSGAVRLTSHIDIEPRGRDGLLLQGAGREVRGLAGSSGVTAQSTVLAEVGTDRVLERIELSPHVEEISSLTGRIVGRGFRAATRSLADGAHELTVPQRLLLDDLPMAVLISGYAALYNGKIEIDREHLRAGVLRPDICSGWRSDGTMLVTLRTEGRLPLPVGPSAGPFTATDEPSDWHEIAPLAEGNMRRRRLIELCRTDVVEVFAMFRDTHVDEEGLETVLHEYSLTARLDPETMIISDCVARPRVLPWRECPVAARSAARLGGHRIDELSTFVSRELRGTSTCTHLNDLLRSLSVLEMLLPHLS